MNIPFLHRLHLSGGKRLRPNRDWFFILAVSLTLLAISVGWNVIMFLRLTRGETLSGEEGTPASASAASITEIHAAFEKREAEAMRYRTEYQFVDPSRSGG